MALKKHLAADGAAALEKRQADDPGVIHPTPSDDAMALERRLPADNVKFPPPIGPPHNDGKVKRSAQTTEGNPWGPWTDDDGDQKHKPHEERNPWGPWTEDKQ